MLTLNHSKTRGKEKINTFIYKLEDNVSMKYILKIEQIKSYSRKGLAIFTGSLAVTAALTAAAVAFDFNPDFLDDSTIEESLANEDQKIESDEETTSIVMSGSQAIDSDDEMAEIMSENESELYHRYGC